MVSSTFFISALLALAPLADASLHQRSARHSRHNGRGIARRQSTNGTASDSAKCVKRSHPPAAASTSISLSDDSVPTASTSDKPAPTKSPKTEKAVPSPDENGDGEEPATTKATKSASATASSTKASAAPSSSASPSSSSSSSSGAIGGLVGALFPAGSSNGWTTASNIASSGVDGVSLTTSNLDVVSSIKSISNPIGTFQGKTAQAANFPKGNWGLNKGISGGMSMYFAGKTSREEWNGAKEMTFGYSIYFDEGFGWNKGGKLPGLYFGKTEEDARGCSGGNRDTECASVRLMWRADGKGEVYTYLPSPEVSSQFNANKALCDVAPESECNDVYGASVGRGAWHFEAGAWNDVSIRVLLNDAGKANGEIEMFFNGKSVVNVDGLIIAASDGVVAQGVMAQSFFGGSDSSWASPRDQAIHFADYSVAITKTGN